MIVVFLIHAQNVNKGSILSSSTLLYFCRHSEIAAHAKDVEEKIILRVESGDDSVVGTRWGHAVHLSAGWDPFELVDQAVAAAAFLSGGAKPRAEKSLPPSLDVFGWCTWDAFYSKISSRGISL